MNYKPEHRRADSLCLLNKIHEEVAAELSNEDLLVRKEWFCIRAFFTCMKNSVDYDPQEEAKLSLQAYRATGASDHGSPPGSQFLINTQVSKWLHESAPAAYMFSRGGRPWDRDIFVESSNPLYNYDPNDDQVLIDAPSTPPPPPTPPAGPSPIHISPDPTTSGLTQPMAAHSLDEMDPIPSWASSANNKNKFNCPCCVNTPNAWHGNSLKDLAAHLNRPNHRCIPTPSQVKHLEDLGTGFGLCTICSRWYARLKTHSKYCQKKVSLLDLDAKNRSSSFLALDIHRRPRPDDTESMAGKITWIDCISWDTITSYPFKTVLPNSVTSPSWRKITANLNILCDQGFREQANKLFHVAVQMIFGPIIRDVTVDPELAEPSGNTVILSRMSKFLDGDFDELWKLSRSVPPPKEANRFCCCQAEEG